jgi:hypothetical protein
VRFTEGSHVVVGHYSRLLQMRQNRESRDHPDEGSPRRESGSCSVGTACDGSHGWLEFLQPSLAMLLLMAFHPTTRLGGKQCAPDLAPTFPQFPRPLSPIISKHQVISKDDNSNYLPS